MPRFKPSSAGNGFATLSPYVEKKLLSSKQETGKEKSARGPGEGGAEQRGAWGQVEAPGWLLPSPGRVELGPRPARSEAPRPQQQREDEGTCPCTLGS